MTNHVENDLWIDRLWRYDTFPKSKSIKCDRKLRISAIPIQSKNDWMFYVREDPNDKRPPDEYMLMLLLRFTMRTEPPKWHAVRDCATSKCTQEKWNTFKEWTTQTRKWTSFECFNLNTKTPSSWFPLPFCHRNTRTRCRFAIICTTHTNSLAEFYLRISSGRLSFAFGFTTVLLSLNVCCS